MEEPLPMSHERIESLSSLNTTTHSEARIAQATSYPAKRVHGKRLPASDGAPSPTDVNDEAPNSQDSHVSYASKESGVAQSASDSSNLSNLSPADSEGASPVELSGPFSQRKDEGHLRQGQRPLTPEVNNGDKAASQTTSQSSSPMSVGSLGLKHGSKRTASGTVKPLTGVYLQQNPDPRSSNTDRNAKRISEQLKTRLSYAMVKVKNGWESHSIDQLETLPCDASPPATPLTQSPYSHARRLSTYSEASDRYLHSPGGQMSPPSHFHERFPTQPPYTTTTANWASSAPTPAAVGSISGGPTLAPAAPISSRRPSRRSISSRIPPNLNTSRHSYQASGHPTTPTSAPARQGILRMPSGQAEKDALETLIFMSSPNNSNNAKHATSTADPSPLRSEFPVSVKRVVFETQ